MQAGNSVAGISLRKCLGNWWDVMREGDDI